MKMQNRGSGCYGSLKIILMLSVLFLGACDSGTQNNPTIPVVLAPAAPSAPPATVLSGVAAIGAALDGATVEVIDASGNLVEIPDTLTGNDGSYSVTLPNGTVLPVIIRITPPSGAVLLSIVPEPVDGATEIVANVNPITNLITNTVLGDVDADSESDLAAALAVVDTTTLDETGDGVLEALLGSAVDYDTFATDPNFVANDGASPGSVADAILDTIASQAEESGLTLEDQLAALAAQETPARLLENPVFQVELVSELVQGGTAASDLESELADIGAIADPGEGEADVFRTIIEVIPALIESTVDNTGGLAGNAELVDIAVAAVIDLVSGTVEQKSDRFDADSQDLVDLLDSPSFQATTLAVVMTTIIPILETFTDDENSTEVLSGLETVINSISEEAASVVSGFEFSQDSTDVSDLVATFVDEQVAPETPLTRENAENIESGETAPSDLIGSVGDVSQVQDDIQEFAAENPDLVEGSTEDLIETIPTGTWDESSWDNFNWS